MRSSNQSGRPSDSPGFVASTQSHGESMWLFAELEPPQGTVSQKQSLQTNEPLVRAQKLAKKMPYLPKKQGERQRAGRAICRLLLASLHEATERDPRQHKS